MALARVVTFDGVDKDRIAAMKSEMEGSERPEGIPASEIIILARSGGGQIGRDRLLRERGRLQGRRRGTRCDADRRHAGHPHVGHEVRRRDPDERLGRRRRAWRSVAVRSLAVLSLALSAVAWLGVAGPSVSALSDGAGGCLIVGQVVRPDRPVVCPAGERASNLGARWRDDERAPGEGHLVTLEF